MAEGITKGPIPKKRKRSEDPNKPVGIIEAKLQTKENESHNAKGSILLLESQILESRKHYNHINDLLGLVESGGLGNELVLTTAFSLCRVFCALMAAGRMAQSKELPENEVLITEWLKDKYKDFLAFLLREFEHGGFDSRLASLVLLMRLLRGEGAQSLSFPRARLAKIIKVILHAEHWEEVEERFVRDYVETYDDVRLYTFTILADVVSDDSAARHTKKLTHNLLSILSKIETIPQASSDLTRFLIELPEKSKDPLRSISTHKLRAEEAWLALLRLELDHEERKTILSLMSRRIAPWFVKVERLMDFLTDSYNVGGSTSILALSGLFYLMQEKNLDYPQFYQKLYSLIDGTILHSRHRSRFFRLLDTFLSSTHLPAALVASFIKRMSRLTLYAPPAGILMVIPWIYNLLKKHPTCTFMIHRELSKECLARLDEDGMDDPFDNQAEDPMQTKAIDSSLWELQMLQSHYHPNIATLAKIISEQFTKHAYNLEDFLDHSYGSMLAAELTRDIKKAPVVEFEIPKRILTVSDEDWPERLTLIQRLWDFI